jgi:hypothetical protein
LTYEIGFLRFARKFASSPGRSKDINRKIQYKRPFSGQDAAKVSTHRFVLAANRDRIREPGGF